MTVLIEALSVVIRCEAIAAPRVSQRNNGITRVDQGFGNSELGESLLSLGYQLDATDEIGAATGLLINEDEASQQLQNPFGEAAVALQYCCPRQNPNCNR